MIIMGKKVKRLYVSVQCTVMFSVFSVKKQARKAWRCDSYLQI